MPNTLAHLGAQGILSRPALEESDLKWVFLGCVIPDVPWILNRLIQALPFAPDIYGLRLYAIAQSSLAVSLFLAVALSVVGARPWRIFAILGANAAFHLLLDALQTKWANGVHLLAPLDWRLLNFGLFWPEDWPTLVLGALGFVVAILAIRRAPSWAADIRLPRGRALGAGLAAAILYIVTPVMLRSGPLAADNHYVATLRDGPARPGRPVAFDRASVVSEEGAVFLVPFTGERFRVEVPLEAGARTASVRGRFLSSDTIVIEAAHVHPRGVRDAASILGLLAVGAVWVRVLWAAFRRASAGPRPAPRRPEAPPES